MEAYELVGNELRRARAERADLIAHLHELDLKIEDLVARRARLEERRSNAEARSSSGE